jgi:mannose/fructose/N-acetylgalactosamine-specific phosphotransferase system component IIB
MKGIVHIRVDDRLIHGQVAHPLGKPLQRQPYYGD